MRLRNNPKAMDILEENNTYVYINPKDNKGKWHKVFGNDHPIYIEIGMGKGQFIIENARKYPDINFIGIEKFSSVLVVPTKRLEIEGRPNNLILIKEDAASLNEVFDEGEIDLVYLNFSDPWPKKKHTKRRLTYSSFLEIYENILKSNGHIVFKTDNRSLFEYSLVSFNQYGMQYNDVCLDLHHSDGYEDNIRTEYEAKFSPFGPIYRIDVNFKGEE